MSCTAQGRAMQQYLLSLPACPSAAPGDSRPSDVNDRSCQSPQQVLMMDGINEIVFEVRAASCKVITQERSCK